MSNTIQKNVICSNLEGDEVTDNTSQFVVYGLQI